MPLKYVKSPKTRIFPPFKVCFREKWTDCSCIWARSIGLRLVHCVGMAVKRGEHICKGARGVVCSSTPLHTLSAQTLLHRSQHGSGLQRSQLPTPVHTSFIAPIQTELNFCFAIPLAKFFLRATTKGLLVSVLCVLCVVYGPMAMCSVWLKCRVRPNLSPVPWLRCWRSRAMYLFCKAPDEWGVFETVYPSLHLNVLHTILLWCCAHQTNQLSHFYTARMRRAKRCTFDNGTSIDN